MYWPKFSFDKLVRLVRKDKRRYKDSGVSCFYVKWTKYAGLKIYTSKKQRDLCYKRQKMAATIDAGPKVGACMEFGMLTTDCCLHCDDESPDLKWVTLYCYWTEHLRVPKRLPSIRKRLALAEALNGIGLAHYDMHERNVGYRGNKLLCIDFDSESCDESNNISRHQLSINQLFFY